MKILSIIYIIYRYLVFIYNTENIKENDRGEKYFLFMYLFLFFEIA